MYLGIDIGGTAVKFGVVDASFSLVGERSVPTEKSSDIALLGDIALVCAELTREYDITAVGIGSPGRVDSKRGVFVEAGNLPYKNTPAAAYLSEKLGLPVRVENDANCAALGELKAGFGKKYPNMLTVTLGTGVGGGIIIGGELYSGCDGRAGEFGHMVIESGGERCYCGRRGCYERYASVTALIAQTTAAADAHPESALAGMPRPFDGRTAFVAMRNGCPTAAAVVARYIEYIAEGLENLVQLFRPDAIVLSGAITREGDALLAPLRARVTGTEVVISALQSRAGVIGAAALCTG